MTISVIIIKAGVYERAFIQERNQFYFIYLKDSRIKLFLIFFIFFLISNFFFMIRIFNNKNQEISLTVHLNDNPFANTRRHTIR